MSWINWFSIPKTIPDTVRAVGDLYTTDKERIKAETELTKVIADTDKLTITNNISDSKAANFFQSSWRPLIGWTTGACIALYYLPQLTIINYVWGMNCINTGNITPFPIKPDDLLNLVYLLLGFGAYRMIEKKF